MKGDSGERKCVAKRKQNLVSFIMHFHFWLPSAGTSPKHTDTHTDECTKRTQTKRWTIASRVASGEQQQEQLKWCVRCLCRKAEEKRWQTKHISVSVSSSQFSVAALFSFCWFHFWCLHLLSTSLCPFLSLPPLLLLSLLSNSPLSSFFSLWLFSTRSNLSSAARSICHHFAACYACLPHAAISSCRIEDCVASPPAANQFVCISSPSPIAFVSSPVETSICICCGRKSTTDATQFMRFHLPRHFLIFFHLQLASLLLPFACLPAQSPSSTFMQN